MTDIYTKYNLPQDPVVEAYKQGIDVTLLRENLKRSIDERFLNAQALQQFAAELKRSGKTKTAAR